MPKLKKGDNVRVFQKWVTREDEEGIAELVEFVRWESTNENVACWMVCFHEDFKGENYPRTVWSQDKVE